GHFQAVLGQFWVLELLRPGETVGWALRRWGGAGRPAGRGRGRGRAPPPPELEALVALADALVARGVLGVLGESRERLQARLRGLGRGRGLASPGHAPASGARPDRPLPPPALPEVLWEYHWGGGQGDGAAPPELFGPFSSAQMQVRGAGPAEGAGHRQTPPPYIALGGNFGEILFFFLRAFLGGFQGFWGRF
uniref:Uncharacterized protein n=1 Tax=Geospiza parvula TaxID=87175 RepID=A0A8U8BV32_GEOPR